MTQSDLELWETWVQVRSRVRGSATSAPSEKHLRENEGGGLAGVGSALVTILPLNVCRQVVSTSQECTRNDSCFVWHVGLGWPLRFIPMQNPSEPVKKNVQ